MIGRTLGLLLALTVMTSRADWWSDLTNGVACLESHGVKPPEDASAASVIETIARLTDPQARCTGTNDSVVFHPGLRITMSNGVPVVSGLAAGSPAEAAGLTVGSAIRSLDGWTASNTCADVVNTRLRAADARPVRIEWDATNRADIARISAPLPTVDEADVLPGLVGYLRLNGFFDEDGPRAAETLTNWASFAGIVLDLRDAGGDGLHAAVATASLFVEPETLLFRRSGREREEAYSSIGGAARLRAPAVVIVNRNTSGAAELLAAVLKQSAASVLVMGEPTAGDPLIRDVIACGEGWTVRVATAHIEMPDGTRYDGRSGVTPHLTARRNSAPEDYEPAPAPLDRRGTLDQELEDRKLRDRVRGDAPLRHAVDILIALKALQPHE